MSKPVISVENLRKSYRLGQIGTGTLTNDIKVWWARKRGKPNPLLRIGQADHGNMDGETLWALRDVSFQVEQGEVLGIIGRNGAGKSTLLKILSRVTAPTSGLVKVKGRIASLLEVGTGFHPDLTGRENIYLNGAILGMTKEEVRRKFDEIMAFTEIEKFIDTPVKRYSSGMYVRLAFAVAAHLESEILLVDEVLAVGDAEFQKKCLGKMGDVASKEGRSVLFVSHNLGAILRLCERVVCINKGEISFNGNTREGIDSYLLMNESSTSGSTNNLVLRTGKGEIKILSIQILDENNKTTNQIPQGGKTIFIIKLSEIKKNTFCNFVIYDMVSDPIVGFSSKNISPIDIIDDKNKSEFRCVIDELLLQKGRYRINVAVKCDNVLQDHIEGIIYFDVIPSLIDGRVMTSENEKLILHHKWIIPAKS